jgi:hypothetical protein
MRLLTASIFATVLLTAAWGQGGACNMITVKGTYNVSCSGYLSPAPGAPQVPASILGSATSDFLGYFTAASKVSLGGTIVDQTVTGILVWTGNCVGTISYTQKINGQPAPNLNLIAYVLDEGKEIRGMSVDPGTTLMCTLKLMSR